MSKNDVTGDDIKSRPTSDAYRDNYDKIFKKGNKNETETDRVAVGEVAEFRVPSGDGECISGGLPG